VTGQVLPATCPCGSGRGYADCCGRWLETDQAALTAEQLMRSRYSAYVLAREDYLLATWHPSSRPRDVELACDPPVQWLGLKILDVVSGGREDEQGQVEFVARYKQRGKAGRLH